MTRLPSIAAFATSTALLALAATSTTAAATAAPSGPNPSGQHANGGYSFAVVGDVPYGEAQLAVFPEWMQEINAADPAFTVHVGDIKSGSQRCDTSYFETIRAVFDTVDGPLLLTPGDNEWTDCHRTNNGGYDPLERLVALREVFFAAPDTTLGGDPMRVASQADRGLPENVTFRRQQVSFALLHVVGSNNGLLPWTGRTEATAAQVAEERSRMAASIELLRETFERARAERDRAVAVLLQADMFDPTYEPDPEDISAFRPLVQALLEESNAFDGQVYVVNGDSHVYNADQPLSADAPTDWLEEYDLDGSAENLWRVTVDGSTNNTDWLRVTVNRRGAEQVLSWEQVPYQAMPPAP